MKSIFKIESPKSHIIVALFLFLFAAIAVFYKGLNFDIDFVGGTNVYIDDKTITVNQLKEKLGESDFKYSVTGTTNGVIKILLPSDVDVNRFSQEFELSEVSYEKVGPKVGADLLEKSIVSALFVLVVVSAYVAFKFSTPFAISGIITLVHDTVLILGALAVLGIKFDITVFAAVLAIIGYTINDTIIVFDKVRYQISKDSSNISILAHINEAISSVFSRTIMTSLTTASVLVSLLFLGGESLFNFSLTLLLGVFIGTMSSIFLSTSIICSFGAKDSLLIRERNKPSQDGDL